MVPADKETRAVGEAIPTWRSDQHRQGVIGFETVGLQRFYGRRAARKHRLDFLLNEPEPLPLDSM